MFPSKSSNGNGNGNSNSNSKPCVLSMFIVTFCTLVSSHSNSVDAFALHPIHRNLVVQPTTTSSSSSLNALPSSSSTGPSSSKSNSNPSSSKVSSVSSVSSSTPKSISTSTSLTKLLLSSSSTLNALPNDNQFYDGYEDFIRNLQEDLENDSFDIYDNDDILQEQQQVQNNQNQNQQQRPRRNNNRYNNNNNNNNNNKRRIFKYKRDMNDDTSKDEERNIDHEVITKLIIDRSKAQRIKDYNKADSILKDLNDVHGVYVWDKDKLWSTSSIAPSRKFNSKNGNSASNSKHGSNNGNDSRRGGANSRDHHLGQSSPNNNQFGRNGHDYIQIGDVTNDTCQLELHEIHALLAKRLEYKLVKQYHKADEIQTELYNNGVRVHDKLRQWRGDGGIFDDIEGLLSGKEYSKNEFSKDVSDVVLVEEIESVIRKWSTSRKRSNYEDADRLRQVLWDKYRVAVDDKSRTWSYGGDFGPNGTFRWTDDGPINPRRADNIVKKDWRKAGMYTQSSLSEPLHNDEDQEEVSNLIHDRLEARRVKDFDVADLIRDHLYKEYRVSVDDQLRQWSVGGEFEDEATKSIRSDSPTSMDGKMKSSFVRVYNLRGGKGHLSDKDVSLVEALVKRRSEEMARYNQQAAESIRNGLKKKFYVVIDDMNSEWHVRGNDFILSPRMKSIPKEVEESRKEIEMLIRERSQAKGEGDFKRADEIRTDLFDTHGITLDDRVKEWSVKETKNRKTESKSGEDNSEIALSSLTVAGLKEKLKAVGLPVSGRKAELIERLQNHE